MRDHHRETAAALVELIIANDTAERPIDKKTTRAAIVGATRVACASGYGHTPFHVEITVGSIVASAGPVPKPFSGGRGNWTDDVVRIVTDALTALYVK